MAFDINELSNDLSEIESDLNNQTFTWQNNTYPCIPNTFNNSRNLGEGGFDNDSDLILQVRSELFPNGVYPIANDTGGKSLITFGGKQYRITKVGVIPHLASIRLYLSDPHRGI